MDGQPAKLRIGDRVPVATGSFQAGVGVGSTAGSGFVNPLVNTQFQYIDVGVNVDITPRVHPNHEVSLKVSVEVSSVTGQTNIGGIQQPIISQRKIDHEIRLKEGEASILGGLVEKTDTKSINGWPGLGACAAVAVPVLGRHEELRGRRDSDHFDAAYRADAGLDAARTCGRCIPDPKRTCKCGARVTCAARRKSCRRALQIRRLPPTAATPPAANAAQGGQSAQMRFEPRSLSLKVGQTSDDRRGGRQRERSVLDSLFAAVQPGSDQRGRSAAWRVSAGRESGNRDRAPTSTTNMGRRSFPRRGSRIRRALAAPGTIMGIVVKAIAPGTSNLSIVQVNAKDSQQKPIPLVTSEAHCRCSRSGSQS